MLIVRENVMLVFMRISYVSLLVILILSSAKRIKTLLDQYGVPEFLNKRDAFLFKMYQAFGYHFDFIAIPIIKKRLRMDTSQVIINEERPQLPTHLSEEQ